MRVFTRLAACCALAALASCARERDTTTAAFSRVPISADPVPSAVVLQISGRITSAYPVRLDMRTIESFPRASFRSQDPWDRAEHSFEGVLVYPLLERIGLEAGASSVEVIAANDYRISIRLEDLARYGHLLSYRLDGAAPETQGRAAARRGALQIALDFDEPRSPEMEIYKHQLVWKVVRIEVR